MAKKTFKESMGNPAMQFISTPTAPKKEEIPEGYKRNPEFIETKSKRVQLLVKPSTVEKLKARAKAEERSFNDLVNSILEESINNE